MLRAYDMRATLRSPLALPIVLFALLVACGGTNAPHRAAPQREIAERATSREPVEAQSRGEAEPAAPVETPTLRSFLVQLRELTLRSLPAEDRARAPEVPTDLDETSSLDPTLARLHDRFARVLLARAIDVSRCAPLEEYAEGLRAQPLGMAHQLDRLNDFSVANGAILESYCECQHEEPPTCDTARLEACERGDAASDLAFRVAQGLDPATLTWGGFPAIGDAPGTSERPFEVVLEAATRAGVSEEERSRFLLELLDDLIVHAAPRPVELQPGDDPLRGAIKAGALRWARASERSVIARLDGATPLPRELLGARLLVTLIAPTWSRLRVPGASSVARDLARLQRAHDEELPYRVLDRALEVLDHDQCREGSVDVRHLCAELAVMLEVVSRPPSEPAPLATAVASLLERAEASGVSRATMVRALGR